MKNGFLQRVVASLVGLTMIGSGTPGLNELAAAPAQQPTANRPPAAEGGDAAFRVLEAAEKEIPRDTFDPAAIVTTVGNDPAALLTWVRDRTYWVPYRGALRGPVGVLMDRVGNSVDRSLLLAELLRTAGHRVRLAHGTLSETQGRDALPRLRPVPANPVPPSALTSGRSDADVAQLARQVGSQADDIRQSLLAEIRKAQTARDELGTRVAAQVPFLMAQLGTRAAANDVSAATLAAIRDHWWVQWQNAGQWIDLDPLFDTAPAGAVSSTPERTFPFDRPAGEIPLPPEFSQDVSIRVIAEQWKGGTLAEKVALTHTLRPAETLGQPVLLQISPLNWPKLADVMRNRDAAAIVQAVAVEKTEWVPVLTIGDRVIRQGSFTDAGEINEKPGQPSGAAGAFAGAFDAFGGGSDEPEGRLTAAWIEFETRVPGSSSRKVRRELFDLLDRQHRAAQPVADPAPTDAQRMARALSLVTTVKILPLMSRVSWEYVMNESAMQTIQNRQTLADVAARGAAGDLEGLIERAQRMKPGVDRPLLELAATRFEWSTARQDTYLDGPNILTYRAGLFQNDKGGLAMRHGFDIVTNNVAIRPGATADPFQLRLTQGVIDTNLEDLLMREHTIGNAGALSGGSIQAGQWALVRQPADSALSQLNLPVGIRDRIDQDLRAGYVVVAPRSASPTTPFAWWRIDPRSGETLGIGPQGWGQAIAEYASVFLVSGTLVFDICLLARGGGAQSEADFNNRMAQCSCFAFNGGALITASLCGCSAALAVGLVHNLALCAALSYLASADRP